MCITKRQIQIHKYKIHNRDSHTHRLAGGLRAGVKYGSLGTMGKADAGLPD